METDRIHFPLSSAMAFSARSVRMRLGRMLVVVMGVASAIAFVVVLLLLDVIMTTVSAGDSGAVADMAKMQKWWLLVAALISVTGITNAILMSVTERIKEIGTIRCLGAMSIHIIQIFLFEAMFLGVVGGILGGILGILIACLYTLMSYGWTFLTDALSIWMLLGYMGIALAWSMILCVLSAIYPVYFASKLEPADAMRYEV